MSDIITEDFLTLHFSGFVRRWCTKYIRGFLDWMYPVGGGGENVESAALGVLILWTTWFGFNAGSTESITGVYSQVSLNIYTTGVDRLFNIWLAVEDCWILCCPVLPCLQVPVSMALSGVLPW